MVIINRTVLFRIEFVFPDMKSARPLPMTAIITVMGRGRALHLEGLLHYVGTPQDDVSVHTPFYLCRLINFVG